MTALTRRAFLFAAAATAFQPTRAADFPYTVLITGSNRGIGFGLAQIYAQKGWHVLATTRRPNEAEDLKALAANYENVAIEYLDVTNYDSVDALAAKLKGKDIDVLINNAGISGMSYNQIFGKLNFPMFEEVLRTNVIGPLKVAEAFVNHVAMSRQKKIVNVTSGSGVVSRVRQGNHYFYRASKAGLNIEMVALSIELAPRGVIVAMLSPGNVLTGFAEGEPRPNVISLEENGEAMFAVIDQLTPDMSGRHWRHTGEEAPI
jgi:NAD(P)-dependent dehydrogenase (short-subunit alcohol dehydrogenase family)